MQEALMAGLESGAWSCAAMRIAAVGGGWGFAGAGELQQSRLPQSQQQHAAESTWATGEVPITACVHISRPASRMAMVARTHEYYALRAGTQRLVRLTTSSAG